MSARAFDAATLVPGAASGPLLKLDEPLSFWGGLDPATGAIIDRLHPQRGARVAGRMLMMPGGRGSTYAPRWSRMTALQFMRTTMGSWN